MIDEFIVSTFSGSLEEACEKTGLPANMMRGWQQSEPATLRDLDTMRAVAKIIALPLSPVLLSLNVTRPADLLWNGLPLDPLAELEKALDVDIW